MLVTFTGTKSLLSGKENLMEVSCTWKSFLLENDCEHVNLLQVFRKKCGSWMMILTQQRTVFIVT